MTRGGPTAPKRIYLTIQRIYTGKRPPEDFATYLRLSREILAAMPDMQPFIMLSISES